MFYTYVLETNTGNIYIGYSKNLKQRIAEHESGKVFSTRLKLPVKLIYYESCTEQTDALKREKYLKSGPGRKFIKYRIKKYLEKVDKIGSS